MTFFDGSLPIGAVPLDGAGVATLTLDNLPWARSRFPPPTGAIPCTPPAHQTCESVTIVAPVSAIGPTVMSVKRYGNNNQHPTYLFISFSAPLDTAKAQLVANYSLAGPIKKRKTPKRGPAISSAVYDPSTITVTLVIAKTCERQLAVESEGQWQYRKRPDRFKRCAVKWGGAPPGSGNPLPGTNFNTIITHKNLAGTSKKLPTKGLVVLSRGAAVVHKKSGGAGRAVVFGDGRPPRAKPSLIDQASRWPASPGVSTPLA